MARKSQETSMPEHKRKRGNQWKYTSELADQICEMVGSGMSLRATCAKLKVVSPATVRGWEIKDVHGFAEQYARARESQAETVFGEIIEIIDTKPKHIVTTKADGTTEIKDDPAHVAWLKNRVDARKWVAAKLRPKVYGDKLDVTADVKVDIGSVLDRARKRVTGGSE